MSSYDQIRQSVITGNVDHISQEVEDLLEVGETAANILNQGLLEGMSVVGDRFKRNEMFLPQVLMAAQAMQTAIDLLKPMLTGDADSLASTAIVIGTVKGDMHDIGKNLVKIMLVGAGFKVIDLGVNVSVENFKAAVVENDAGFLCLSALLSSTMDQMRDVVRVFREDEVLRTVKILVGGAPLSRDFAIEIGADGYAPAAPQAVDLVQSLLT